MALTANTNLARALGVASPARASDAIAYKHGGRTFRVRVSTHKSTPIGLSVSAEYGGEHTPRRLESDASYRGPPGERTFRLHPITIRHQTSGDTTGEKLGFAKDLQSGHPALDGLAHMSSSSPREEAESLLADTELAEALVALLARCPTVTLAGYAGLLVAASVKTGEPTAAMVEEIVPLVGRVASAMPRVEPMKAPGCATEIAVLVLVCASLFGGALYVWNCEPFDGWLNRTAIAIGLGMWTLAIGALYLRLRRSTGTWRIFVAASLVLGLLAQAYAAIVTAACNAGLDTSPPDAQRVVVTQRWSPAKVGSFVRVSGLRGRPAATLEVRSSLYAATTVGTPLVVTTRAGRLGMEWVESIELAREP